MQNWELMLWVIPTELQDPALALVEPHEVPLHPNQHAPTSLLILKVEAMITVPCLLPLMEWCAPTFITDIHSSCASVRRNLWPAGDPPAAVQQFSQYIYKALRLHVLHLSLSHATAVASWDGVCGCSPSGLQESTPDLLQDWKGPVWALVKTKRETHTGYNHTLSVTLS